MYAGGIMPIKLNNKIVRNESHHPIDHNCGPRVPREKVLTVKLADILTSEHSDPLGNVPNAEIIKGLLVALFMRKNSFNSSFFATKSSHKVDTFLQEFGSLDNHNFRGSGFA
jgi:hypothetical protein